MKEIKLYLVRHGKTYCNERQLYCGKSDVELSESGKEQLMEISRRVKYTKCDFYFTSGAKRANQTLEIICPQNKYKVLNKFFEYDFGDFELRSYEELKLLKEYITWIEDEEGNVKCPSGESRAEFRKRVNDGFVELINYIIKENIDTAFGVIHGGSIGMLLEMFYDSKKKFYEWQPSNGEGYELTIKIREDEQFEIENVSQIQ
ncbi:histidine phosphatase family protein [Clostridium beijerinckii]|jgi:Fructose-2,6-bisphosphatase|uniref:Phosphoglycerate mutase family protein n=2 Tax=Clostridium beijerinckii TaxID=1520 RepID=A0AAE2RX03_CLOBE|nr:phosphoglycerate mutase family protein [Clostridium beijerinckii]ABR33447.1 Phosphoglycerate mutase [Clostridium beijerinckii NCIMB 8052]AIU03116.1 phosphoglycerate mutase [Clostridium beijerinckii ATCC 35702]MBC2456791.1 phosphoglycerate mutase family protein [Clostridium beijerinckii]MBC2474833.1 phosphoglycerate mutase family protein [Clostridium beijerinckii]MBF7811653.1 phosphoglycerate mutase family protein [Clostridium beijerinckii]